MVDDIVRRLWSWLRCFSVWVADNPVHDRRPIVGVNRSVDASYVAAALCGLMR
jgi:hypothetical protein